MSDSNHIDASKDVTYFNSRTTGLGYLNFVRLVPPKKKLLAVNIAMLRGDTNDTEYTRIQTIVYGHKAIAFVKENEHLINDKKVNHKVLVRFTIGDVYADSYLKIDDNTGEEIRRNVIKGRLTQITWASIDGVVVLDEKRESSSSESSMEQNDTGSSYEVISGSSNDDDVASEANVDVSVDQPDEAVANLKDGYRLNRDDEQYIKKMTWLVQKGYDYDEKSDLWLKTG